jgi:hypothetical protein
MGESLEEKQYVCIYLFFIYLFFLNTCTVSVKRVVFISAVLEADLGRAVRKPFYMNYVICGVVSLHFDNQEDNVHAGV